MSYLEVTHDVYREAALKPDVGLCCTTTPIWQLPGLDIPKIMQQMNYGCGSTVHPRDLVNEPTILYVGVGGGMELLQFSYFSRRTSGVIGVDIIDEMLEASRSNMLEAEKLNPWFKKEFVELKKGDALHLPVADASIDVAAQNCLFNIFRSMICGRH
jgi:SAM-dependent methyltransferase